MIYQTCLAGGVKHLVMFNYDLGWLVETSWDDSFFAGWMKNVETTTQLTSRKSTYLRTIIICSWELLKNHLNTWAMFRSYVEPTCRLVLVPGSVISFPYTSESQSRGCYPASGATAPPNKQDMASTEGSDSGTYKSSQNFIGYHGILWDFTF